MKRNRTVAAAILLLAVTLLTACGFHLRGSMGEANLPFKTLFIGFPPTSTLGAELRRAVRAVGTTEIVNDRKQAEAILESMAETRRKEILSLNSQGRVREYSLFYLVRFQVVDQKGAILMPPTNIELRRTLNYSETEALAKEAEEQMLYRDMQSDLVQQIVRRLTAIKMPPPSGAPVPAVPAAKS